MTKTLQTAHLQAQRRALKLTAGRYKTLLELPQSRMERHRRRAKLNEVEAEIARVEQIIEKLELGVKE